MISGIVTAILLLSFIAIVTWAWLGRNQARWQSAAQLPLQDEPVSVSEPKPCCQGSAHGSAGERSS